MSTGKLKAQYNRVRTSVALQSNNIWTKTIGVESNQSGANAVVEASLRAPTHGAGGGRAAKRQRAQELIQQAGYEPAVTSFEGLVALARAQGNVGSAARGACKICGGLGHLTKQCKNVLPKSGDGATLDPADNPSAMLALLPGEQEDTDLSSLSDLDSSSSDSSDRERSEKRSKSKKRKKKESKSKSKKSKHKKKKHKKS